MEYNAESLNKSMRHLRRDHCFCIACGECVQVCRDQIPHMVAFKHILVLLAEYVFSVFAAQAVEMEVEGVETGKQMPAFP